MKPISTLALSACLVAYAPAVCAAELAPALPVATAPASIAETKTVPADTSATDSARRALDLGLREAIAALGREGALRSDADLHLAAPEALMPLLETARSLGAGRYADAFERSLDRAAEQAIAASTDPLLAGLGQLAETDAAAWLRGNDDESSSRVRQTAARAFASALLPAARESAETAGVRHQYAILVDKSGEMGRVLVATVEPDFEVHIADAAAGALLRRIEAVAVSADVGDSAPESPAPPAAGGS